MIYEALPGTFPSKSGLVEPGLYSRPRHNKGADLGTRLPKTGQEKRGFNDTTLD